MDSPQFNLPEQSICVPEEIVEEILLILPVKSLLRFRCVSKPWRSLIGSKRFIRKHLLTSTKNPNFAHHNILAESNQLLRRLKQCSLISMLNEPFAAQFTSCHSMNINWNWIRIVGCCNGIVCLLLDRKHFMLCNPSTRKTKKLPDMDDRAIRYGYLSNYGFGYDDSSDDYMVFGIASFYGSSGLYKVYSLRTNSWKIVEVENAGTFYSEGKFASGKIHWMMTWGMDMDIIYFDLRSEVFEIIKAPIRNGFNCISMRVFRGRLGLLYNDRFGKLDTWVVKEYGVNASWEKVASISYLHTTLDLRASCLSLLGRGPNGEILLRFGMSLEKFFIEGNRFRHFPVASNCEFREAVIYVESLVPL